MNVVNFDEWLPDQPDDIGMYDVINAIPIARGYHSIKSPETIVALPGGITGDVISLFGVRDSAEGEQFFIASSTEVWWSDAGSVFADATGAAFTVPSGKYPKFVDFGERVVMSTSSATSGLRLQSFILGTDTTFSELDAAAPYADHIAVVRDFIMVGNVYDGTNLHKARIQWCGINDPTTWGQDTAAQSDWQDVPDVGECVGLVGGEYAVAFFEQGIVRIDYAGPPTLFNFDAIVGAPGCVAAGSVVTFTGASFWLSSNGFWRFDGSQATPIGLEKVDDWFYDNVYIRDLKLIRSAVDPVHGVIFWLFPIGEGGNLNAGLIYHPILDKWARFVSADVITSFAQIPSPVDIWNDAPNGGDRLYVKTNVLGYIDDSSNFKTLTGNTFFSGTFETGDIQLNPGGRAMMTRVQPMVDCDGTSLTVAVGYRNNFRESATFDPSTVAASDGTFPVRRDARFHRVKIAVGGVWDRAHSFVYEAFPTGVR